MVKRILYIIAILLLVTNSYADTDIKLIINDVVIQNETKPLIINNRTMLPVRVIFESLGADVQYDSESKTIYGNRGSINVTMKINDTTAYINGLEYFLDSPPVIINGRTYAPARFLCDALNYGIEWIADSKTIIIRKSVKETETNDNNVTTKETATNETTIQDSTETTTVSTESSTETTTFDYMRETVNQDLAKKIGNDIYLIIKGHTIGSVSKYERLSSSYIDSILRPSWESFVKTRTDRDYCNTMLTVYRRYTDYARGIDHYYIRHSNSKDVANTCRRCKNDIQEQLIEINKTMDIDTIKVNIENMKQIYEDFENSMKTWK